MNYGLLRRKFGKWIIAIIAVAALSTLLFVGTDRMFRIQIIEVAGNDFHVIVNEQKISKNLLFFPADKFKQEILADNPLLKDIFFKKKFPHTLSIIPILRSPFVRLQSDNRRILMDQDAVVLEDGDRGLALPLLVVHLASFRVGETITDNRVVFLLEFLAAFKETLPVSTITEYESSYYQIETAKTDIFITHNKPIADTIATLQTLITGFRIKGTLPAVVDLRFDKPIVKF